MDYLELVTERHDGWFVDLFVRPSNKIAVGMYRTLGKEASLLLLLLSTHAHSFC